jgi:hypothetical protein
VSAGYFEILFHIAHVTTKSSFLVLVKKKLFSVLVLKKNNHQQQNSGSWVGCAFSLVDTDGDLAIAKLDCASKNRTGSLANICTHCHTGCAFLVCCEKWWIQQLSMNCLSQDSFQALAKVPFLKSRDSQCNPRPRLNSSSDPIASSLEENVPNWPETLPQIAETHDSCIYLGIR